MDYEKKYNEALERVRRLHDRMLVLSSTDALVASSELEFIFPELKESDDEGIRKLLVWQVHRNIEDETNDLAGSVYDGIKGHDPDLEESIEDWKKCLAWLEKQKEPKHATDSKSERVIKAARSVLNNWLDGTDCPDVSGDFAELEYAIREYDGEEKQQENPKSADSIPSDCTSDAKCEDRWHKVSDSLPDNGRLVLANDCLGNILLARYDGEGNWEVSVYDNEDYYCRNTITKWCEIPSEKQKEQKPVDYDHEMWKNCVANFEGGKKEVIEHPEKYGLTKQKPAEWSEDFEQNIRILLYDKLMWHSDDGSISTAVFIDDKTLKDIVTGIWFYVGKEAMKNPNMELPKQEWSEEDEEMLDIVLTMVDCSTIVPHSGGQLHPSESYKKDISEWLKSLRPSWKPSKEQLTTLLRAEGIVRVHDTKELAAAIAQLYEQLKKL